MELTYYSVWGAVALLKYVTRQRKKYIATIAIIAHIPNCPKMFSSFKLEQTLRHDLKGKKYSRNI